MTTAWVHIISLALYAAATLAILVYAIPRARVLADPQERLARAAAAMKIYDPFSIAVLGVIVMTGAFSLTAYKDALRERFFEQMGAVLIWKFGLTFLLIIMASYMAFGLGNRIVGHCEIDEEPTPEWISRMLTKTQVTAAVILVLCGVITWVAGALT